MSEVRDSVRDGIEELIRTPLMHESTRSIWSSLSNPTYCRLWSALVVSGCCVSAHEMAATWAMNSLRAPALWLSLMSSAGTLPFFLFTLPAGALADLADRRRLLRIYHGWLACSAGLMAFCAVLGGLTPGIILGGVFLLGTGFAFQAPAASASIPEIVGKEDLPSAIALGGIQMNLSGIIGPALGGLLIPVLGVSGVFAMNAAAFVLVLFAVATWKRKSVAVEVPLESFFDSLAGAVRYMRYAPGVRIVLLRNLIFGVLIGATPALLPVLGLKTLHLDPFKFGLLYTSLGVGSLAGAIFILEPARTRLTPNQMTILGGIALAAVYALMAVVREPQIFLLVAALAGGLDSLGVRTVGGGSAGHTGLDPRPDECLAIDGVPGRSVIGRNSLGHACNSAGFAVGLALGERIGNCKRSNRKALVDRFLNSDQPGASPIDRGA